MTKSEVRIRSFWFGSSSFLRHSGFLILVSAIRRPSNSPVAGARRVSQTRTSAIENGPGVPQTTGGRDGFARMRGALLAHRQAEGTVPFAWRNVRLCWRRVPFDWRSVRHVWRNIPFAWRMAPFAWRNLRLAWRSVACAWRECPSGWRAVEREGLAVEVEGLAVERQRRRRAPEALRSNLNRALEKLAVLTDKLAVATPPPGSTCSANGPGPSGLLS